MCMQIYECHPSATAFSGWQFCGTIIRPIMHVPKGYALQLDRLDAAATGQVDSPN